MTTKTIAYLRVSTDKQANKGISLEAQEEKARAYASLYDLDLIEVIIDAGESAKTLQRPGLQRALRAYTKNNLLFYNSKFIYNLSKEKSFQLRPQQVLPDD